jgi:DNA-binding XRE family transcriptional regulator
MYQMNDNLNRTLTAEKLGVTRKTICLWIKELNNLKS